MRHIPQQRDDRFSKPSRHAGPVDAPGNISNLEVDPATGFAPACSLLQVRRLSSSATPEKNGGSRRSCSPSPQRGHSAFEAVRARLSRSTFMKIGRSGLICTGISRLMKPAHGSLCYGAHYITRNVERGARNKFGRKKFSFSEIPRSAFHTPRLKWWTVSVMLRPVILIASEATTLCSPTARNWCGTRELHPHDLFGRQGCWLLHQCRNRNGRAPGTRTR